MNLSFESVSESEIVSRQRDDEVGVILNLTSKFWEQFSQYFLDNNLDLKCLEQTAALINAVPNNEFKVPKSKYLILKQFHKDKFPITFWIYCTTCLKYESHGSERQKFLCPSCNRTLSTKTSNFFVMIGVAPQLQKIIEDNWHEITEYQRHVRNNVFISDILSGRILRNLDQGNPYNLKLSLMLNADGIKAFKSSLKSLWPIQFICNFLPPATRFHQKNIIVSGLYLGCGKPDMLKFFEPIAREFQVMEEDGILINIKEEIINVKVNISHCSLDLPAQSMVQGITLYSGYESCPVCHHFGVSIKNEKNDFKYVRYIWRGLVEKPRSSSDMLLDMKAAEEKQESHGMQRISCLVAITGFDFIHGFAYDYMHGVLLGIVNGMLNRILTETNKPYHLNPRARKTLSERILRVKLCRFFSRRLRGLEHRKFYKANEYRSLFLYVLPLTLRGLLPNQYYEHFCSFSALIYELLKENVDPSRLDEFRGKMVRFVCEYEKLYGSHSVTMNLHRLLHITEYVSHSGPLWATSLFAFESNNHRILKSINGNQHILAQIAYKYSISARNQPYKKYIESNEIHLNNPMKINLTEGQSDLLRYVYNYACNENVLNGFGSVNFRNDKFTSTKYTQAKTTIDYFVKCEVLGNELIAKILFYFVYNEEPLMMVQCFDIVSQFNQFYEINGDDLDILEITSIEEKLFYIQVESKSYVVSTPNRFEKD